MYNGFLLFYQCRQLKKYWISEEKIGHYCAGDRKLTASTRKGITSIMIRVDFTPIALKNPIDPKTESITRTTPDKPSSTCNLNCQMKHNARQPHHIKKKTYHTKWINNSSTLTLRSNYYIIQRQVSYQNILPGLCKTVVEGPNNL